MTHVDPGGTDNERQLNLVIATLVYQFGGAVSITSVEIERARSYMLESYVESDPYRVVIKAGPKEKEELP